MRAWLSGLLVSVLVFLALLFGFASGTGAGEFVLWLAVALTAGALVVFLMKKAAANKV